MARLAKPIARHQLPADFAPEWAHSPGEVLQRELTARGLTQAQLSLRTSLSPKHINQLIKGTVPLSADVAIALERTLDVPADFWLRTEASWRATASRAESLTNLTRFASWFSRFPLQVLIERKVINKADDSTTRIDRLLRLFQVTDTTAFDKVWLQPIANFKRSQRFNVDPYATALWIRLAEIAAERRVDDTCHYDAKRLRQLLSQIPQLTTEPMPKAFISTRELLASAGVLLVFEPEVDATRICGASRWLPSGHPVVALTNRNKRLDSFWFYLAHELAHILLHPGRATYVDLYDKTVIDDKDAKETAADEFAERLFLTVEAKSHLERIPVAAIESFAAEAGIASAIAAGQYAHATDRWRAVSKLRPSVNLDDMLQDV